MIHILPPTGRGIRGPDSYSSAGGHYGAGRTKTIKGQTVSYPHRGIDFVAAPGEDVLCPLKAEFIRVGYAYPGDNRYRLIVLVSCDDPLYTVKLLYLKPKDTVPGERYEMADIIGAAQDLRERYPADDNHPTPITPHIHLEVRRSGALIDPTPLLLQMESE